MPTLRPDTQDLIEVLQYAGWIVLRHQSPGHTLRMTTVHWECASDPWTAYGYTPERLVKLPPSSAEVDMMDDVCGWLGWLESPLERRCVAGRMLYDLDRGRVLVPYRVLAAELGLSTQWVREQHLRGLTNLVRKLHKNVKALDRFFVYMDALETA